MKLEEHYVEENTITSWHHSDYLSWSSLMTLGQNSNRRFLVGEGEACTNVFDCDGNLECCATDKICRSSCVTTQINTFGIKSLNEKCEEHYDCQL